MTMTDAFSLSFLLLFASQILLDVCSGLPVMYRDDATDFHPRILNRFERSLQPACTRKKLLSDTDGIIVVNTGHGVRGRDVSCTWIIHVPREQLAQVEFWKFHIKDTCPGICQCNYLAVKEHVGGTYSVIKKYCNERKPPRNLIFASKRVRIHLRLKAGTQMRTNFEMRYIKILPEKKTVPQGKSDENMPTYYMKKNSNRGNDAKNFRVRKQVPSAQATKITGTAQPTQKSGPSKLTILLAVSVPVVLIFILVVFLIAYYNYWADMKAKESGEDIQKSGATISDLIMNSSITLTPMFNLGKARRESSHRKEKANKLYDDMLQNWREMNANKKMREKAKEESVNTWESYKKHKQRRNTRDVGDNDSQAFAMLVNNAINVATTSETEAEPAVKGSTEEIEDKPRTNSILINGSSSNTIRHSRGSKVISWSDVSTIPPKDDESSRERTKSAIELKSIARGSGGSAHIPAIVVSQPSIETEDDEAEANDTDRLIKTDSKDIPKKTEGESSELANSATTYSCTEHVKDILRESYGDELEDWFRKPQKKSASQGSLQHVPDSNVKYQAMKTTDDDNGAEDDID